MKEISICIQTLARSISIILFGNSKIFKILHKICIFIYRENCSAVKTAA